MFICLNWVLGLVSLLDLACILLFFWVLVVFCFDLFCFTCYFVLGLVSLSDNLMIRWVCCIL